MEYATFAFYFTSQYMCKSKNKMLCLPLPVADFIVFPKKFWMLGAAAAPVFSTFVLLSYRRIDQAYSAQRRITTQIAEFAGRCANLC